MFYISYPEEIKANDDAEQQSAPELLEAMVATRFVTILLL